MAATPDDEGSGIRPDEAIVRPPIEVLGEDGVARPLDEAAEPAAPNRGGDVHWLEERVGAAALRDLGSAAGVFTARVSWGPCGPGDVVLGWAHPVFTADSRVFVSAAADPPPGGSQPPAGVTVTVTHVRSQRAKLLIGVLVGGGRPVQLQVDVLVVEP